MKSDSVIRRAIPQLPKPQLRTPAPRIDTQTAPRPTVSTALSSPKRTAPAGDPRIQARFQADTFTAPAGRKPVSLSGSTPFIAGTFLPPTGRKPLSLIGENTLDLNVRPLGGLPVSAKLLLSTGGLGAGRLLETLGKPGAAPSHAVDGASSLSRADQASAEEAIEESLGSEDPQAIADWLEAHPNPEDQAAFYDYLFSLGPLATGVLNHVDSLSEADKQLLADGLGAAYESGAVTDAELEEAVVPFGYGAGPGETHAGFADIVSRTGNADLINTFVERELEIAQDGDPAEPQRAQAAAIALAGLPPEDLQEYLARNPEEVEFIFANGLDGYSRESAQALGNLLSAAADIQPPTEESLKLFTDSLPLIESNPHSREGAADFFIQNMDYILSGDGFGDGVGSLTADGQRLLSRFLGDMLFTEPSFPNQEALKDALTGKMAELNEALNAHPDPASEEALQLARQLGSLVGTVESGFLQVAEDAEARNEAVAGFVDLLFSASELIPGLKGPGGQFIQSLGVEALNDWVTGLLSEDVPTSGENLPFNEAFGETLDSASTRGAYDDARGNVFTNRTVDREG